MTYTVTLIPGDGTGPELAAALWLTCGRGMGPSRAARIIGAHRDTVRRRRDEALDHMVAGLGATRLAA